MCSADICLSAGELRTFLTRYACKKNICVYTPTKFHTVNHTAIADFETADSFDICMFYIGKNTQRHGVCIAQMR